MHPHEPFERAFHDLSDELFRFSFFKVGDRDIALDLVQECFTKTWTYLAGGGTILNFKAFLYRTLRNLIVDYYREKKYVSLDKLADTGFEPADTSQSNDDQQIAAEALAYIDRLPDQYREVMFLRYVNDLSFAEIAALTGESENALSVRVHRGIQKLRDLMHL